MPTVADLIVQRLRDAGVGAIFGVPGGGSNLDLIAAAARAGLPFVLTSSETAAAIAAIGHAEVTGAPGVCLTTLGPGAASAVNGVACAFLDRAPMIVFTDSHPAAADDCSHQRLDHRALFVGITKASVRIAAEGADTVMRDALALAMTPPFGPVHLDCPGDVLSTAMAVEALPDQCSATASADRCSATASPVRCSATASPDWCSATALAERSAAAQRSAEAFALQGSADLSAGAFAEVDAFKLPASRRPLFVVGLGARKPADAAAIRMFCETRGVPAMVTYKAKGVVPDDHSWFAGVMTNASIERPLIDEADLLIGLGLDPVELIPRPWTIAAPIVQAGPFLAASGQVPFAAQLVADIPDALRAIGAQLPPSEWQQGRIRATLEGQRARIAIGGGSLTAQCAIASAARQLAPGARVTVDAGAHMFPATMLWPVDEPNGLLISNGLSTMGFALPAAIGAALADRARPVVALTGDGGLLMCLGELATAVRERLRIIVVVFADGALSLIQSKQAQRSLPEAGVALGRVEWAALAQSFGVAGFAAADEAELERALTQAIAVRGPSLIEARIDPANYGRTLRAVRG
ncbi:MAG TPA: thiamine pyrophosphate-binding protein [Vicinamibacterales bacterium]|nr:thiamine pyrophosphate-binding protein [Vicinamibacterales bacterium]